MRRTLEGLGVSHLRKDAHGHRPHRHAEPRPCNLGNGIFITNGYLVVSLRRGPAGAAGLAAGTARRALIVGTIGRAGSELVTGGVPEELAAQLCTRPGPL